MGMLVTIETGKGERKGRSFSAEVLAWIRCPNLLDTEPHDRNVRPPWMVLASSEQETRAFMANFRRGKVAEKTSRGYQYGSTDHRFQVLKTSGHRIRQQKLDGGGVVTTLYLPELFLIDPGLVDPEHIRFIMLPDIRWLERQRNRDDAEALLFLAYLDRRCRFPFPPKVSFARALLDRCLEEGWASRGQEAGFYRNDSRKFYYTEHGLENLGLPGGIAFSANHETLGKILSEEIARG